MKYSVITFGCRVNQADSLRIEEDLRARGATAAAAEHADVVVINTCSVTATADQGARQTVRRVARENPGARIYVTGCYATRESNEVAALAPVRVVRNPDKDRLVGLMAEDFNLTTAERFAWGDGPCGAVLEPGLAGRTAFTLRVQTGCDEACSYCIIPSTRGKGRSAPSETIFSDLARVAAAGFKEVALAGVHLGSYGRDLTPSSTLAELLRGIHTRCPGLLIRISSLEPMDCTPAIVDLVAGTDRFAPHFHLPLQHASDRLLAAMRRPYTIDFYSRLVENIRTQLPHASIGSDVIAGFPGETDADFQRLSDYLESSPLTHLHVFPYSDRPGTVATSMPQKVHGALIRDRARQLRAISDRLARRFRCAQVGSCLPGLTIDDGSMVLTDNYLKVRIAPGRTRNERVKVRLTDTEEALCGTVVG